jgi:hypothetical protein
LWLILSIFVLQGCAEIVNPVDQPVLDQIAALKIITMGDGFYEISLREIQQSGLDFTKSDIKDLAFFQRGALIPFWTDEDGGDTWFRFYAPASTSRYTQETITILTRKDLYPTSSDEKLAPGENANQINGGTNASSGCIQELHFEENNIYQPKAIPGEPWLWVTITAPGEVELPIELNSKLSGDVRIRIRMWALTEAAASPDHKVILGANGLEIGSSDWDGKGWQELIFPVSGEIFKKGVNLLTIQSPGLSGVIADKILVDWIQIDHPATYNSGSGQRKIQCNADTDLPLADLAQNDIYIHSNDGEFERLLARDDESFHSIHAGDEYWLIHDQQYLPPKRVTAISADNIQIENIPPGDYLVIGDRALLDAAQGLIEWRKNQGLSVTQIAIDTLYDYFNDGYPEPAAIRSFLYWTSLNWQKPPRYVLLLGDASYDPKGYQYEQISSYLPSFFIETQHGGETTSDFGFSILSPQEWPDLNRSKEAVPQVAVGRLPASTEEQIKNLTAKIIEYENQIQKMPDRNPQVLVVADRSEDSFRMEGENFSNTLPETKPFNLFVPGAEDSLLTDFWKNDPQWIVYFGHGSIQDWGSDQYMSPDTASQLPVQLSPPIVLQFTCLTGLFSHPDVESISEKLLWNSKGGAIALLAPTSLTLPGDQSLLSQELAVQMGSIENKRLGDLILNAWRGAAEKPVEINDVIRTFALLGDPGLLLP